GYYGEGRERLAGMLALSAPPTPPTVQALPSHSQTQTTSHSRLSFTARALNGAGALAALQGDYATARSMYEESLAISRELGDKRGIAVSLGNLGNVAYGQGDYAIAHSLYEGSLALMRELGVSWGIGWILAGLGGVAAGVGQASRGTRLLGAAEALEEAPGSIFGQDDRMVYEQGIASARAQLSEEEFEKAWAEGRAMTMEQAIEYAIEEY
ncbi:MAG: tetratricopeptide repeat protein, partial [Chloroflexia bacterium]